MALVGFDNYLAEVLKETTDRIETEIERPQYQSERLTWRHNEPNQPFPPHEALNGLTFTEPSRTEALSKSGWAADAIYGRVNRFIGDTWYPGDHLGCECAEAVSTVNESVDATSNRVSDSRYRITGVIDSDGPAPTQVPGVPASINARLQQFLRNEIDAEIDDGTLVRQALARAGF